MQATCVRGKTRAAKRPQVLEGLLRPKAMRIRPSVPHRMKQHTVANMPGCGQGLIDLKAMGDRCHLGIQASCESGEDDAGGRGWAEEAPAGTAGEEADGGTPSTGICASTASRSALPGLK